MICEHVTRAELSAYADEELPTGERGWWDDHLRACRECRERLARIQALRVAVRNQLPPLEPSSGFREELSRRLRAAPPKRHRIAVTWRSLGLGAAAAALFIVGLAVGYAVRDSHVADPMVSQVVEGHVRSLEVDHLVDIASSEHHVVRPWFSGKLDFAPPVPDLAAAGFPLVGGRLDYLANRAVAALVYRGGPHTINLLLWPDHRSPACDLDPPLVRQGFNLLHGRAGGMEFWAISDLNRGELEDFVAEWQRASGAGAPGCPGAPR